MIDFTQKVFLLSLDPPSKYLTDVSRLDRALRLGQPSRRGDRSDRRRACLQFKKLKFTWLFCLDRKTTKRRNDEMTTLAPDGGFVERTIVLEPVWAVNDRFFVSFRSFVVSSFRDARRAKSVNYFA